MASSNVNILHWFLSTSVSYRNQDSLRRQLILVLGRTYYEISGTPTGSRIKNIIRQKEEKARKRRKRMGKERGRETRSTGRKRRSTERTQKQLEGFLVTKAATS